LTITFTAFSSIARTSMVSDAVRRPRATLAHFPSFSPLLNHIAARARTSFYESVRCSRSAVPFARPSPDADPGHANRGIAVAWLPQNIVISNVGAVTQVPAVNATP
jgi:hypothetical protein